MFIFAQFLPTLVKVALNTAAALLRSGDAGGALAAGKSKRRRIVVRVLYSHECYQVERGEELLQESAEDDGVDPSELAALDAMRGVCLQVRFLVFF